MKPISQIHDTSFAQLYNEHHTWLHAWLCKRMGNQHDAADLVQETFIRLLQKQDQYHGYQPRALLTTIAKNLSNTWWRRKQIEQIYYEVLQHSQMQYHPSPEEEMIAIQTLMELQGVLNSLKPRTRQVFLLAQLDGLSYAEIAEQLNVSIITVKRDIKQVMLTCLLNMRLD